MATIEDKTIKCVDCGEDFLFTAGEQEFYREKSLTHPPTRCKRCREARKGQRPNRSSGKAPARGRGETFPAVCAECGAETQVPFMPTGERPVYCRDCFQAKKGASGASGAAGARRGGARPARSESPPPTSGQRTQGAVKWFNEAKGFGFIQTDGGEELFLHSSAIQADGLKNLTGGERVEFDVVDGNKGKQAANVVRI